MIRFIRRDTRNPALPAQTITLVRLGGGSLAAHVEEPGKPVVFCDLVDGEVIDHAGPWEILAGEEFVGDFARKLARILEIDADWREDEDPSLDAFEVAEALRNAWTTSASVCEAA